MLTFFSEEAAGDGDAVIAFLADEAAGNEAGSSVNVKTP
jgi:hypothetical protein